MNTALEHDAFAQQLDAYLAGGLSPDEAAQMQAHAADCPMCADLLAHARATDARLNQLFESARPDAGFENRLLSRLGTASAPLRYRTPHPLVLRVATGVAAAVLLGGVGYAFQFASSHDRLPTPWAKAKVESSTRTKTSSNLRQMGTGVAATQPNASPAHFGAAVTDFEEFSRQSADQPAWYYRDTGQAHGDRPQLSNFYALAELKQQTRNYVRYNEDASAERGGDLAKSAVAQSVDSLSTVNGRLGEAPVAPQGPALRAPDSDALNRWDKAPAAVSLGVPAAIAGKDLRGIKELESLERKSDLSAGRAAGGAVATNNLLPAAEPALTYKFKPAESFGAVLLKDANAPEDRKAQENVTENQTRTQLGREMSRVADSEVLRSKVSELRQEVAADQNPASPSADAPSSAGGAGGDAKANDKAAKSYDVQDLLADGTVAEKLLAAAPPAQPSPAEAAAAQTPSAQPPANPPTTADTLMQRKIIRNGEMTFEVDGFDSALLQIGKIAQEEQGFVATTSSEKLANGKVKGSVVVRVPPDRLDTLVLKLRGLGDLRASRIAAQDITKQYTDIDSQLRAAHAMENRLLEIIKTGKGEIKDLIEAEKQLGEWREKIEHLEGEIRYYNNLVSLSTLTIELNERDIRTASMVTEAEQVNMGVETPDVEKARAAALKAIEEAKGRIIESDLKRLEAGQFLSRIVAEAKPDAAGPLTDRLKQLGRVARLEIERKQKSPEGATVPAAGVRVEKADTRFIISIYNLAAVAPRVTTNLNLAAPDVEAAYRTILDQVQAAGGRVVTSQLNRLGAAQTTGTISFETPADQGDVVIGAIRGAGEVMKLEVNQNTDTQNSTESKRGFVLQVYSMAAVNPRETTDVQVAAAKVPDAFATLREVVRSSEGRVLTSQLAAQDAANETAQLVFEVPRAQQAAIEQALQKAGTTTSRNVNRSPDAENTVDSKVRYSLTLLDAARLNPRQTVDSKLAVKDVSPTYAKLLDAVRLAGATIVQSQLTADPQAGGVTGTLVFDIRGEAPRSAIEKTLADSGDVYARTVTRSQQAQGTLEDKTRISLTIIDAQRLPPRESTTIGVEVTDVERSKGNLEATAIAVGGSSTATVSRERNGDTVAQLTIFVPLAKKAEMIRNVRDQGKVVVIREVADPNTSEGQFARAKLLVTLGTAEQIVSDQESLATSIRRGLAFSAQGLLWSLQWIIVGVCFILPWVAMIWLLMRWVRGSKRKRTSSASALITPPAGG